MLTRTKFILLITLSGLGGTLAYLYAPRLGGLRRTSMQGLGGLPKDEREAARLFKLAADQGNAWAQNRLRSLPR